ncbi:MAG: ABC transporter permease [Clostridiales bacterium]|nr:ABC transporter permease [Clostridiales bacterium]
MLKVHNYGLRSLRSGSFICLIVMLIFGAFSITTTSLLIRAEKKTQLEDLLTKTGDYEVSVYNAELGFEDALAASKEVDAVGLYYELGTVTNASGAAPFRAVALRDELSEELYHLTCFRGTLPEKENEVAMDISVANAFGVAPYPGEKILLKAYNSEGEYIGDRQCVLSGVYKLSSEVDIRGWSRGPDYSEYTMPGVFFSPVNIDSWGCTRGTVFFRSYSEGPKRLNSLVYDLIKKTGKTCSGVEYNYTRVGAFTYAIGVDIAQFDVSRDEIQAIVDKGDYTRDFYSEQVFPVISVLVVLTEAITLFMLSKNIIANRKEHYAILRSIGMSSRRIILSLSSEMLGFGIAGTFIGIGLGYAAHALLIRFLNVIFHARLHDGIHVEKILRQVTYDPMGMSLLICVCSLVLSLIIPLYKLYRMYPSELLSTSDSMFVGKKKGRKKKSVGSKRGWLGLLNKRIDLHEGSTMLVMMIVLAAMLFGYVFFRAYSEKTTAEPRGDLYRMGLDGEGYVASISSQIKGLGNNVFNRHDAGVSPSSLETIENDSNIERIWSVIFNESTRMVFSDEPDDEMKQLLGNRSLNRRDSDDPSEHEEMIAEATIYGHMGYDQPVYMYELPTVGLTEREMTALNVELVDGQIDHDKIRRGEEVVLAVPEELKDLCLTKLPVGSALDFDDILLSEDEEMLSSDECWQEKWIVYDTYVETNRGQRHVGWTSFGSRHSVRTKVGAIVVLHDEKDITEYLSTGTGWVHDLHSRATLDPNDPEPAYGMSILCLPESFMAWGLPDRNFTSVKVTMKDDYDTYGFDKLWYTSLAGSSDVMIRSTFTYSDEIDAGQSRVMTVFFLLISVLILLGIASIISGLYTKTRSNLGRFQTLRRIGLSVNQASLMIYTQNIIYPLIATVAAIIPVYAVQRYFDSILHKMQTGELLTALNGGEAEPWYWRAPIGADFFSYNFVPALICCFLIGTLLILLGTLPQIIYLRKMKMIETREE